MPGWIVGNLDFYFNPFSAHKTSHDVPENFQLDYLMPHAFLLEFRYSVPSGVKQITPNKHFWHAKPFGKGGSLEKNLNLQYTLVGRKRVKIDQDFFIRERGQIDQDFFHQGKGSNRSGFFCISHSLQGFYFEHDAKVSEFFIHSILSEQSEISVPSECSLLYFVSICSCFSRHILPSVGGVLSIVEWQLEVILQKWEMDKSILNFDYCLGEGSLLFVLVTD